MMKAIALISGGLDSMLAAEVIKQQGLEVIALNFNTHFCPSEKGPSGVPRNRVKEAAAKLGLELTTVDIGSEFIELIKNPKHGFGSNMNPCIDCKIMMLKKTKKLLSETGASFVVTGEVLGQRPMSQHRQALETIERESGLEGLLLRPLSAKLLPETIPEKEGWVSRDKLLDLNGRSRKPQIGLAKNFGIKDYPNAAGGCLLTEPLFVNRLKDALSHGALDINTLELLKIGRHFRLSEESKLIIGRNERENQILESLAQAKDYLFMPNPEMAGPTALGRGIFNHSLIELSARIVSRYCDRDAGAGAADIVYKSVSEAKEECINVPPLGEAELVSLRL
jgi:tRNA-specific 2-thiouridylase